MRAVITAALVTASVAIIVSAIGSTTTRTSDSCQEMISNSMMSGNCNGIEYQAMPSNGPQQFPVVTPPR